MFLSLGSETGAFRGSSFLGGKDCFAVDPSGSVGNHTPFKYPIILHSITHFAARSAVVSPITPRPRIRHRCTARPETYRPLEISVYPTWRWPRTRRGPIYSCLIVIHNSTMASPRHLPASPLPHAIWLPFVFVSTVFFVYQKSIRHPKTKSLAWHIRSIH